MYGAEGEDLTLAAAGDAIVTRKLSTLRDERFAELVRRIRDADVSFANLEVLLHDYEGYPAARSGGTYMRAPPWVADELRWAGFDIFAAATNHVGDFSHGGMEATMRTLDERGLAYAGLGSNLAEARSPTYVDTSAGRVALVAACTTITPGSEAGMQRPDMRGRPGLSPLRLKTRYVVSEETLRSLAEVSERLGLEAIKARRERLGFPVPAKSEEDCFTVPNVGGETHLHFEAGDEFAVRQMVDEDDAKALRRQIAAADAQADWVLLSVHTHEGDRGSFNDRSVPAFLEEFARDCVEAGADAVIGHGSHALKGIEIYRGAPVFYGLGNFAMQNETVTRLPAELYEKYGLDPSTASPSELFDARVFDAENARTGFLSDRMFWESLLPVCRFAGGELRSVELYPLDLGFEAPRPQRGRPVAAEGEAADRILDSVAELSEPYDTDIRVNGESAEITV